MARYGQRPENALKRANEFISVGKPARALDTLQDVFRNKKWAYSWSESVLEPIMFKYLDLCVELKRSHIAKEGLFQYRNMFQAVNVGSLENVIRGYLRMAEERTESAREQSAQAVVDIAVDDLDNLTTPESLLLSAVSGEDAHDRSDRTILTPWVKFLWESYCQCLELLRINSHVEALYHDIARMAFQFCLRYGRKTEFRKLCDKLRKHLEDICKVPTQVANVSIQRPETQQLNLETRLCQLDSAIQMELWQEAYKAIEDVHGLMHLSKKPPVPKTMANYYQKLAMVFWKAGNQLFHAAALLKLFQLSREMKKNMSSEELHRMACRVVVAVLAVPLPSAHPEFDRFIETDKSPLEKAQRLAVLLGLQQPPTRASLLRDTVRTGVVTLASLPLQDLYNCLEVDFDPLQLCSKVVKITNLLEEQQQAVIAAGTTPTSSSTVDLVQYIPALHDVTLVRLVRQVAQVYQTIQFDRLLDLAKFTTPFHLERLLVECVRHNDMQIRIDHARACIHFGMDLSESQREDRPEGPTLQTMPSEQVRQQLVNMATVLQRASHVINPQWRRTEREQRRADLVKVYHDCKFNDHQLILQRHKIIEDRKEYIERLNSVREEEEARRLEELQRQQAFAEHKRLLAEREEREKKREREEIKQIRDRHVKEKVQAISQTKAGQRALRGLDEDDIKRLDADQIAAREAEELQKERRELQAKLKSQEKKVDYLERAKRLEEIPLLQNNMAERQTADQAFWEQQESERIETALEERKISLATKERLSRMEADRNTFIDSLLSDRSTIYTAKLHEFDQKLTQERRVRLARRKQMRQEERILKARREREEQRAAEEAAEREREEQAKREKEEKERKEREEKERVEREERLKAQKEQQEMLDRVAAKQRQREEEVERKLQEEKEQFSKGRDREQDNSGGKDDAKGRDSWRSGSSATAAAASGTVEGKPNIAGKEDTWRTKSGATTGDDINDNTEKAEAWKPSRMRGDAPTGGDRERDGGVKWRRGDREPERERDNKDRDRDNGRRDDRDDGGRRRYERDDRDRDGRRDERDRDGRRDDRERDGRRDDRDKDGRKDDRDRDGRRDDRDRDVRRDDRDRDGRRDDRDRDGRRDDRDRDRYGGRDSGRGGDRDKDGGGSWRKAGEDSRDNRGGGATDWRRDTPSNRDRDNKDSKRSSDNKGGDRTDKDKERVAPVADDTAKRQQPRQQGGEGGEDGGWEMQKRR